MATLQQIVDEIRLFLPLADQQPEPMRRLAGLYNAACHEANVRLHRCDDYLAKGLRSEAIHFAQTEPVLLDAVAVLDFPERRQWDQLCADHGAPLPPALNLEAATLLNEAYADDQPLEVLLRKHRLLNLGRAPVASRLALLRRLAELDGRNSHWEDDVRAFERVRLQEIQSTLGQLVQGQNAAAVLAVAGELASPKWRITPPPPLVIKAQTAARRFQDSKSLAALKVLEGKLNDAMAACDVPRALALRDQWNQLARGKPNPGDPIWPRVAVVLQWVDQQARRRADDQAFQAAVNRLEVALGSAASVAQLEAPYAKVRKFNQELPDHIQARYQAVASRLRFAAIRRQVVLWGAPTLAALLLGAGIAWWLVQRAERGRVATAAGTVNAFLDAGQVAEAKAYFTQLERNDAATAQAADLQALKARIHSAEHGNAQRRQSFQEALAAAQDAGLDDKGDRLFQSAQALAVLPEEKSAVQYLRQQRQARRAEQHAALEQTLLRQADALALKLDELDRTLDSPYDAAAVAKALHDHWKAAQDLLDRADGADAKVKLRLQTLIDRVQTARKLVQNTNAVELAISDLTFALESSGGVTAYIAALEKYVAKFPDSGRSAAFKQALAEQDLWEAALAWQRLAAPVRSPLDLKPADAAKLAEQVRQFGVKYPRGADSSLASEFVKALDALAERDENNPKSTVSDFRRVFGALTVRDIWWLRTDQGKEYYSTEDLSKTLITRAGFNYLVGYDGTTKSISGTTMRTWVAPRAGRSAQALIAEDVANLATGFAERHWEESILTYARKVREAANLDPILKTIMLRQILECGGRASYPLARVLDPHLEELKDARFDITVPWMDPDSEAANKQRPLAREFINQLPPYDKLLAAADAEKQKLAAELGSQRAVLGWLYQSTDGWGVASYVKPMNQANLYVIAPGGPEQPASWRRIGATEDGKVHIQPSADHLIEGRLVFAVRSR